MCLAPRRLLRAASAGLCLAATAAHAQTPKLPYLTYTIIQQGTYNGAQDVFKLTLYGYEYQPGQLPQPGSPEYIAHSVSGVYEVDYENPAINAFPLFGTTPPTATVPSNWTFSDDIAFTGGPEGPNDPTDFLITAPVGTNRQTGLDDHLYDQTFYLFDQNNTYNPATDGKNAAILQSRADVIVRPIRVNAPTAVVPEPAGPAVFGLGGLVLAGLAARRRRAASPSGDRSAGSVRADRG